MNEMTVEETGTLNRCWRCGEVVGWSGAKDGWDCERYVAAGAGGQV